MPENRKTYKLENLASIKGGKRMPKGVALIDTPTDHPYIRVTNMGQRKVPLDQLLYVPNEVFDKISRYIVSKNDVILSIVGTIGAVAIISDELHNANLTENCVKLTELKNIHYSFLYYYLKSNIGQNEIAKGIVGSTQPKLPLYNIQNIDIELPPLQEQKSIASILSALDDKIELNLQMNKTLEEMAMALYKHWFVDFGPFRDGEFVDSELGKIPKGWEVKSINKFGQVVCGKTPSKKDPDNFTLLGGYPFIKIPEMHGNVFLTQTLERISEKGNQTQAKKLLPSGCINVSCIATVGLVTINALPSHTNQQINSIIPKKTIYRYYLYSTMISLKERFLNEASGGSATLNMNTSTFSNIEILKPDEETLQEFSEMTASTFSKILQNQEENQTLTQLRDTLLPKLISGEVRVKDAEKTLSEVL